MPLNVKEFVIQAKVIEDGNETPVVGAAGAELPASVKKEIIDECFERIKEYIDRSVLRD